MTLTNSLTNICSPFIECLLREWCCAKRVCNPVGERDYQQNFQHNLVNAITKLDRTRFSHRETEMKLKASLECDLGIVHVLWRKSTKIISAIGELGLVLT